MPNYTDASGTRGAVGKPEGLYTQGTMLQVGELSCVVQRFLSSGGHANVYLVTLMRDGLTRVLKHIPFGAQSDEQEHRQHIEQEINYMTQLKGHAHIVTLEAAEVLEDGAYILMEHCTGDVLSLMNTNLKTGLEEAAILHIFCDVCKAVAHMHYQHEPLLHRDLKVENILTVDGPAYKLCDFGSTTSSVVAPNSRLSREQIVRMEEEIQRMTTLEYRAPEMIDLYLRRGITEKVDIWALGVLLYKLCYFRTPFDNASPLAILNAEYSIPGAPAYSKELKHIFQMTLREEPRERSNIFTLCSYVCSLRGEPCLLENKYASPPVSPSTVNQQQQQPQHTGLGYISGHPVHHPRRYAASSSRNSSVQRTNADTSRPTSTNSELDSDSIVPMRRGRPPKPTAQNNYTTSASSGFRMPASYSTKFGTPASAGGRLLLPSESQPVLTSAPVTPQLEQYFPANYSRSGSRNNAKNGSAGRTVQIPASPSPMSMPVDVLRSAPIRSPVADADDNALGIYQHERAPVVDESNTASGVYSDGMDNEQSTGGRLRRMRMSVKAPDGRESLSADFVQGAVFGSARRTSVLRRNPSVLSTTSTSSRTSRLGATSRNSSADVSDDLLSAPPIGRRSISNGGVTTAMLSNTMDVPPTPSVPATSLPEFVCQPLPPPPLSPMARDAKFTSMLADDDASPTAMITPLSMRGGSPGSAPLSSHAVSFADFSSATLASTGSEQTATIANEDALLASRLSTILESGQDSSRAPSEPPSQLRQQRAPIKSIYEMTLDKLENDMRFSVLFDDQPLFDNAKAKYAAQRSSVYQSPDNYFDNSTNNAQMQSNWDDMSTDAMDLMMRKMDAFSKQGNTHESPQTVGSELDESYNGGSLDIDTVLQHAEKRNRQKLIAQNNRRSMYITGAATDSSDILQEDVDDNMRVLSGNEMDELLQRMDMYNRELLSEQQKWRGGPVIDKTGNGGVDMQSLTRIIEHANDQLLRKEQTAPGRMLQNVISAAKMTFSKPTVTANDIMDTKAASESVAVSQPFVARADSEDTTVSAVTVTSTSVGEVSAPVEVVPDKIIAVSPATDRPQSAKMAALPVDVGEVQDPNVRSSDVAPEANHKTCTVSPESSELPAPLETSSADGPGIPLKVSPSVQDPKLFTAETVVAETTVAESTVVETTVAETAVATANTDNPPASAVKVQQPSRIPKLSRMRSDISVSKQDKDPLAEARARLKKKQSTPMLTTTKTASPKTGIPRAAFLTPPEAKQSPRPAASGAKGKPVKSVRNLVAMFDKS
ncbi:Ark- serine/threonine protein kinase [Coemansia sp. RSA 720]|nr:Ark- serine/threonine protein kinase [Coemansia sp. RSA 720]